MIMLNNSGVYCFVFFYEIKDIITSCSINKRKFVLLNIGVINRLFWSEFEFNVLLNFCNFIGLIFIWKSKKKILKIFIFFGLLINLSKEYVLWDLF